MWREYLTSGIFWSSAARSYVINVAFGISINLSLNWNKTTIPFLDGFHGDMAAAFTSSAFFCGLLTPLFSSCFIRRKVQMGAIRPPDSAAVERSWLSFMLKQGAVARSFILAAWNMLTLGVITVALGGLARWSLRPDPCELEVWAFLVILVVWCVPAQVQTSLLNYTAAAHCARRPDSSPLAPRALSDMEGSQPLGGDASPNEQYLIAAVKMNVSEVADFPAFFSKVNPEVQQKYEDLCKDNHTLEEYMANPLVFILANNPQCCAHIARDYVDSHSPCSSMEKDKDRTPIASTCAESRTEGSISPPITPSSTL
mmetsp:Transcript_107396/g.334784  ORF Transcript_107396/g.334784 Transcript_107396/m.334784 type:complete len:313 (-) Transcript_107396:96-1034(-)